MQKRPLLSGEINQRGSGVGVPGTADAGGKLSNEGGWVSESLNAEERIPPPPTPHIPWLSSLCDDNGVDPLKGG